jgi:hypothetical protein
VSELYRLSDRRLSAKLVPTFSDKGCLVASVTDPLSRILGFLDRSHYYFLQVAPQLYSRGWVDPVPDPLLLRKSRSAGNRTRDLWICSQGLLLPDHIGSPGIHYVHLRTATNKLTNSMERSTTREATIVRPLDSFPVFHGTRRFNTQFTRVLHLFLS